MITSPIRLASLRQLAPFYTSATWKVFMADLGTTKQEDVGASDDVTKAPDKQAYWRANIKLISILLTIWFVVSFGFGIVLAEPLNSIQFFGFKLGFWWAQQGSIYVFVALIFAYVEGVKRIERRYGVSGDE